MIFMRGHGARKKGPEAFGKIPERPLKTVGGNHRLDGDAALAGRYRQRSPQGQYPFAHPGQTEAEFFARRQAAAVVADSN
jgi:hypothetical protein